MHALNPIRRQASTKSDWWGSGNMNFPHLYLLKASTLISGLQRWLQQWDLVLTKMWVTVERATYGENGQMPHRRDRWEAMLHPLFIQAWSKGIASAEGMQSAWTYSRKKRRSKIKIWNTPKIWCLSILLTALSTLTRMTLKHCCQTLCRLTEKL